MNSGCFYRKKYHDDNDDDDDDDDDDGGDNEGEITIIVFLSFVDTKLAFGSSSCSTHSSEDLNNEANSVLPGAPERDALQNGGSNGRPPSPVQGVSHVVTYNRNPIYTVPRLEDVDHQYRKASSGVLDDREVHVERVGKHGTEDRVFQWRDSWNVRETRFASPEISLYNQESPLENSRTSLPSVSGRPTPSEMASSFGYRDDEIFLPRVPASELHSRYM